MTALSRYLRIQRLPQVLLISSRDVSSQSFQRHNRGRDHGNRRNTAINDEPIDLNNPDAVGKRIHWLSREGHVQESLELWKRVLSESPSVLNDRMVTTVLKAVSSRTSNFVDKGTRAEQVWTEAKDFVQPNAFIYNSIMNAHSKTTKDPQRGPKAEAWLRQMEADGLKADKFSYTTVIDAYGSHRIDDAQRIFDEYIETQSKLETSPFAVLMKAWSRHPDKEARSNTEKVMQQLLDAKLEPSIQALMAVLNSQVGRRDGGERAEEWCRKYESRTRKQPDAGIWTVVLHAWAMSGRKDAGEQADRIVQSLKSNKLNTTLHNVWMSCWFKSGDARGLSRALTILQKMEKGRPHQHPDALSYSGAMQAWAKSGLPEGPQKAEDLLTHMQNRGLHPTIQCYEAMMDAHARTEHGSERVLEILMLLEKLGRAKVMQPSVRSYAAALLSLSHRPGRSREAEAIMKHMGAFGIAPNLHCYSLLITCYANDKNSQKALQILEDIKKPNMHIYTAVIAAFINSGDTATATRVLHRAHDHCRETGEEMAAVHINAILQALKKAGTVESAEEAERIFRNSLVEQVKPNASTFSVLITSWAQVKQVDRAVALFNLCVSDYPENINSYVYTSVLNAYANSHDSTEAALGVERLLTEMIAHGHVASNVTLTIAIGAYVRHDDYHDKAKELLEQMERDYKATGDESIKPLPQAYEYLAQIKSSSITNLQ